MISAGSQEDFLRQPGYCIGIHEPQKRSQLMLWSLQTDALLRIRVPIRVERVPFAVPFVTLTVMRSVLLLVGGAAASEHRSFVLG